MKIKVDIKPTPEIISGHGLDANGAVQVYHTHNVNRRIGKYMPHLTGMLETKLKQVTSGTEIRVAGPYARYQYYGKVMVGNAPKVLTERNLAYTTTFNPLAGPFWDRRLIANEKDAMRAELQRYVSGGGK